MDVGLVMNELSLEKPANDIIGAKQLMYEFISTLSTIKSIIGTGNNTRDIKITLYSPGNLQGMPLAPDYQVSNWMNDSSVERERRLLFMTLATKGPYIDDITDDNDEFLHQGNKAQGLGFAFQCNHLAISLKSDTCWDNPFLQLEYNQLIDNGEQLLSKQVEVTHANCKDHVLFHRDWLHESVRERPLRGVSDGAELWKRKEELFPDLRFCETVKDQLHSILRGQPLLRSTLKRLLELEQFCADWSEGSFDPQKLPCKTHPESTATLQMFEAEHTFRCPDGQNLVFTWHVYLTPGAWRIFFRPDKEKRQLIIGHIGHKLPNVLYPT